MTVLVNGSEIILSGTVGDLWFEDCFTNAEVILALAQVGAETDVTIRVNSGGGIATEGSAIHATLSRHTGRKTVVVEGIAASAASVFAMAGDEVVMSLGAVMMVHDPSNITWGTADDHRRTIAQLDAIGAATAGIYAKKTGRTPTAIRAEMKAELWMTADQAVAQGYADTAAGPSNDNAATQSAEVSPFDYRRYRHAPLQLATLAAQRNWTLPESGQRPPATAGAPNRQTQEIPDMPIDKERADTAERELAELRQAQARQTSRADAEELATLRKDKADRERRDAIMALDDAKGREQLAQALAESGITPEKAQPVLAAAPKQSQEPAEPADAKAYERTRLHGAGLGGGGKPAVKGDKAVLAAAVERTNKRR